MDSVDRNGASLRRAELAQIHIAAKQLGIDRDTYEAMLHAVARVRSAGDLDWSGRKRVLEHLRQDPDRVAQKLDCARQAWS